MIIVLEGELHSRGEGGADTGLVFVLQPGQISGMLPYSRLTVFPRATRAVLRTRVATLAKELFPEMLQRIPELGPRLVAVMADRIRNITREEQHREKLAALGKISAGLAHELNNPSAAAARAAQSLREAVTALRNANLRLDRQPLSAEQRSSLADLEERVLAFAALQQEVDPLERSDREQALGDWLEAARNCRRLDAGRYHCRCRRQRCPPGKTSRKGSQRGHRRRASPHQRLLSGKQPGGPD